MSKVVAPAPPNSRPSGPLQALSPAAPVLLHHAVGPAEVPRGGGWGAGRAQASSQLPDGLAHGAGVLGQAFDVLEGQVDDLVAARVAVEVAAGEALQAGLVGDAALAVGQVGAQRQRAGQGAALQAAGLAGAQLSGSPENEEFVFLRLFVGQIGSFSELVLLWPKVPVCF